MAKGQKVEGWWFSDGSGILPHGDGRRWIEGKRISTKGRIELCSNGLHASETSWQALGYAPGATLHKVLLEGTIKRDDDKLCATSRTVIASRDATDMLRLFARKQALSCLAAWDAPDIARQWLETGDETLRSAARSAAWSAAWSAARSAAWSAAESAAWSAARSAARSAAESAARSAAESAARSAAGKLFNQMAEELFTMPV